MMNINTWYVYLWWVLILESLFPIFSYFATKSFPVLWLISLSSAIAVVFWLIIFIQKGLYNQYKNREILVNTMLSSVFIGLWLVLYFFWIKYSSPSVAAILLLLQSFMAFVVFNLLWGEKYNYKQIAGSILMFIWWVLVLYQWDDFANLWAWIMILACCVWTIGNYYTKKASLVWTNPFFLVMNRNILMMILTAFLAYIITWTPDLEWIYSNYIWILLIGFFILFLSKSFWVIALSKLNSFVAISSFPFIPLLVIVFSYFILGDTPSFQVLIGFIPIFIGSFLLVKK